MDYKVNGHDYGQGYYLADGFDPSRSTFVKKISNLPGKKHKHFAKMQEATMKDIERALGVLQARFAIVQSHVHF